MGIQYVLTSLSILSDKTPLARVEPIFITPTVECHAVVYLFQCKTITDFHLNVRCVNYGRWHPHHETCMRVREQVVELWMCALLKKN